MVYFDNAATSFPKPRAVISELVRCVGRYCGNPGRSSHRLSQRSAEAIYRTRELVAEHFGFLTPENVVFTYNATYALNLAIKSFLSVPGHVLVSDVEHNAVMRPIYRLARTAGAEYSVFSTDGDIYSNIISQLREDTVGIISTLESNVTGRRVPLEILSRVAAERGLFLIVDASQSAGHLQIDLTKTPCDVLCAPGHKGLFGIQGCGFALFKDSTRREGLIEGGSGSDSRSRDMPLLLPEGYEAGTLSTPAIVTLGRGIEFVNGYGIEEIRRRISGLSERLCDSLSGFAEVSLYSAENGIISFNFGTLPSSLLASELDKRGIYTRGGLHCAPLAHEKLGTVDRGTVRLSLSCFNTEYDTDKFHKAMADIVKLY